MHLLNKILPILYILVLAAALAGCSSQTPVSFEPVNITYIFAPCTGERQFDTGIRELSTLANTPGASYSFISAEGHPTAMLASGIIPDLSERGYNAAMLTRALDGIRADLNSQLAAYRPSSPEIDLASAIELSVRALRSQQAEGKQNILCLYTSGKSTSGLIDLREMAVWEMDVEESAAAVAQKLRVDLSDIRIVWYGAGELGGETSFSSHEKEKLKDFYRKLLTTLGADSVTYVDSIPPAECFVFPNAPVSGIPVEEVISELHKAEAPTAEEPAAAPAVQEEKPTPAAPSVPEEEPEEEPLCTVVLTDTMVRFKPDSAEFLDPQAAAAAIHPVAEYLVRNPKVEVLCYGTCAGDGDTDYSLWLGRGRADSVREALIAAGVKPNQVTSITARVADDPFHKYGLGTGPEGAVNRKVVLLNMEGDLAQKLVSKAF